MDFSATIHLTRKRFIFPSRYLKADHFEKKLDIGGGPFKNAEGGGLKNYECQFLDPPKKHTNNFGGQFLDPPKTHTS